MAVTPRANVQTSTDVTAWVDLASPSHPFLFAALVDDLPVEARTTVRRKTETVNLATAVGMDPVVMGRDFDNATLRKLGIPLRTAQLSLQAPRADVSLSARNAMCVLASKARGVPSIHFTDNDITAYVDGLRAERLYNRLEAMATYNVVPAAFRTEELTRYGASPDQIYTYDGCKEDIYVADLDPDPEFLDQLPFDDYVVVRPEALDAAYVDDVDSVVPELLDRLVDAGEHVVYLPRGRGDESFANDYPSDVVYTPESALDGLQLAYHSRCVLTGSGTMAREAAAMRKPAVSFFPNELLSVDRELVAAGRVFHSRSPADIVDYVTSRTEADIEPDMTACRSVRDEVLSLLRSLIERHA